MNAISRMARRITTVVLAIVLMAGAVLLGQTREKGPWWPSPHGAKDQAGNSNYITPEKIAKAVRLAKTGQVYELGHMYEARMPGNDMRPYYLNVPPTSGQKDGQITAHGEYFTGSIGQMGTSYDSLGHQGRMVKMADGTLTPVYYNGFTEQELTGRSFGSAGLEALGIEQMKPIVTRGILIDVAAYKGVPVLETGYEVTSADLRGALAKQGLADDTIERGDAVLLHYGWGPYWSEPQKYNKDGGFFAPGIGMDAARWLAAKGIVMVGADTCCVQIMPYPGGLNQQTPHHELFFNGGLFLENMDLTALARDRVYEFLYVGVAERIKGATGSPVRPLAIR